MQCINVVRGILCTIVTPSIESNRLVRKLEAIAVPIAQCPLMVFILSFELFDSHIRKYFVATICIQFRSFSACFTHTVHVPFFSTVFFTVKVDKHRTIHSFKPLYINGPPPSPLPATVAAAGGRKIYGFYANVMWMCSSCTAKLVGSMVRLIASKCNREQETNTQANNKTIHPGKRRAHPVCECLSGGI